MARYEIKIIVNIDDDDPNKCMSIITEMTKHAYPPHIVEQVIINKIDDNE